MLATKKNNFEGKVAKTTHSQQPLTRMMASPIMDMESVNGFTKTD